MIEVDGVSTADIAPYSAKLGDKPVARVKSDSIKNLMFGRTHYHLSAQSEDEEFLQHARKHKEIYIEDESCKGTFYPFKK